MPRLKASIDELSQLADNSTTVFVKALERVVRSQLGGADRQSAMGNLRTVIVETMTLADLLGRRRLMLEAVAFGRGDSAGLPPVLFKDTPVFPRLTFLEAVRDLTSRKPLEGFNWRQVAEIYQTRQGFALALSADTALTERVQKTIERFLRRGIQLRNAEKIIAEMGGFTRAYSETIYRTNLATAYSAGRFEQAADPDVAAVIGAFEYVTAKDSDVRRGRSQDTGENHLAAEGFIAATTDEIWDTVAPPSGYQCILPGNRLSGRFVGGLQSKYIGPAVEIQTRHGRRLSVTVNHPILTTSGWIRAGNLYKGQHCIVDLITVESFAECEACVAFPETSGRAIYDQDSPTSAENVFQAFVANRCLTVFPGAIALNLHGDAKRLQGKVNLVGTYNEFMRKTVSLESLEKFKLVETLRPAAVPIHTVGVFDSFLEGFLAASGSFPGGAALSDDSHAVHFGPLELFSCGPASRFNSATFETETESGPRNAQIIGELFERFPGEISTDEIVDVKRFHWDGHIYDFETEVGWMVAEGIPIGNCRCSLRMVPRAELKRRGLVDQSGRVTRVIPANFVAFRRHPAFARSRARQIYR